MAVTDEPTRVGGRERDVSAVSAADHVPSQPAARIGPNAIIRMDEALNAIVGREACQSVFAQAGLLHYLDAQPTEMVDEREVMRLHDAALAVLAPQEAEDAAFRAGELTATYLLARRIPKPFQRIMPFLPPWLRARLFLAAIRRHAWTFVGSGAVTFVPSHPVVVSIAGGPVRGTPTDAVLLAYYSGCFQELFRSLVHRGTRAVVRREGEGFQPRVVFDLRWR
nr:bacteriochlorophyll 4-vinyl reductase [Afifella sp. H1R]